MPETIDDLIILGRSWPEPMRDNRYSVCVAGYSHSRGFIRLYPTPITSPLKQWNIVKVDVERNKMDSRPESWKIIGSKNEWNTLDKNIKVIGELKRDERIKLIKSFNLDRTENLLDQKRSMGLIKPDILGFDLKESGIDPYIQTTLSGFKLKSKNQFSHKPYIRYRCIPECSLKKGFHDQQLMEWGAFMWLNKYENLEDKRKVFDNLRLKDDEYEKYFVVGNLNHKRKTFAIISVIRFKHRLLHKTRSIRILA